MFFPYRPTHLKPQHSARRFPLAWCAALVCALLAVGSGWYAFAFEPQWSLQERQDITAMREKACSPRVSLRIGKNAVFEAEPRLVCSWLEPVGKPEKLPWKRAVPSPVFSRAKIAKWVEDGAKMARKQPVNGKRQLDAQGKLVRLLSDPIPGVKTTDNAAATAAIFSQLQAGVNHFDAKKRVEATLNTQPVGAGWENQTVETPPLPYNPQPQEMWVDVDLKNHTASAYVGTKPVINPVPMVDGHPLAPTVQGVFHVYQKLPSQVMQGVGWDGPYSETAPWIAYFSGDFALHGAPWRSSFVYTPEKGSHGCVNLSVKDAKRFYDWVQVGTTVVSHN